MARISGVNIPSNKKVYIGLTYIYGIGQKSALDICNKAQVDKDCRVSALSEPEILKLREVIDSSYTVEGELRREVAVNIKALKDIKCYRGSRHILGLPAHGQRTHTNARTKKGKRFAIAGKKKITKK